MKIDDIQRELYVLKNQMADEVAFARLPFESKINALETQIKRLQKGADKSAAAKNVRKFK